MVSGHIGIWTFYNGERPTDENGKNYHIHHIDGNHDNNCIENLAAFSELSHFYVHYTQGDYNAASVLISKEVRNEIPESVVSKVRRFAAIIGGIGRFYRRELQKANRLESKKYNLELDKAKRSISNKLKARYKGHNHCSLGSCKNCSGRNRTVDSLNNVLATRFYK